MDFSKKEDRIKYLEDKFDNLLDVIGLNYGTALMEELVLRLNDTIDDFDKEMSDLFKLLKEKEKQRQKYLKDIKSNSNKTSKTKKNKNSNTTKWEEKLKKLEKTK